MNSNRLWVALMVSALALLVVLTIRGIEPGPSRPTIARPSGTESGALSNPDLAMQDLGEPAERQAVAGAGPLTEGVTVREPNAGSTVTLRVFDELTNEPLGMARVVRGEEELSISDAGGTVVLPVPIDEQVGAVEVQLDGYAPVSLHFPALVDGATLDIPMRAGAVLRGRILGTEPEERLVVDASAQHRYMRVPRGVYRSGGPRREWEAEVDASGGFELRDLPPDAPIHLRTTSSIRGSRYLQGEALVLAPGSVTELVWDWIPSCELVVTVVDASGRPVPNCPVDVREEPTWNRTRKKSDQAGLLLSTERPPGRLRFETPDGGANEQGWAIESRIVELQAGDRVELQLVARKGVYLTGRVVNQDGSPYTLATRTSGPFVWAWTRGERDREHRPRSSQCDDEGRFRIGPLLPREYIVTSFGGYESAGLSPEALTVAAPADELELRFRPAGSLIVQIIDGETGVALSGMVASGADHGQVRSMDEGLADSTFLFSTIAPGEHTVLAIARDGRVGVRTGIEVEADKRVAVEIPVGPGGELVVRRPTDQSEYIRVRVRGFELLRGRVLHGDRTLFRVPAGAVIVERVDRIPWIGRDEAKVLEARRVTVDEGERVEVRFE